MALSAELKKLHDSLSCCTYNGAQHSHVLIKETDAAAKLKSVRLAAPTGDWFSFDPDGGRKYKRINPRCNVVVMSPLLATGAAHNHHRACDCVVLVNRGEHLTVLYIDLKSGDSAGASGQFKSTRQFVHYALGLLKEFYGTNFKLAEERFVVLYGGRPALLNKTTTVPKFEEIGKTKPDQAYRLEVTQPAKLYLKQLLA